MTNWLVTSGALLLLIFFYGLGATLLLLPRRWRPFWPAFCLPVGLGVQSALVWVGAHFSVFGAGTEHYARATLVVPVMLLGGAWLREDSSRKMLALLAGGARGWWPIGLLMLVALSLQLAPFARHPYLQPRPFLSAISLGSCDAADYAAGGRVLQESKRGDTSGFIGQSAREATPDAGDFFEFWLRLNHFSPSALLAVNGSLLGHPPWKLASLLGVVLLVCGLPVVHWLARAGFGFRPVGAWALTLLYACNPIELYAIYQTALAQLIIAPAIALLTWTGWRAYRDTRFPGQENAAALWRWSGLWLLCHWLVLGSYHFFLPFAYAPLLARIAFDVWRHRSFWPVGRWSVCLAANLVLCAGLFPERVSSLVERYSRFHETPFGWNIPSFGPPGWFGLFADAGLHPAAGWLPVALAAACLLTLVWTLAKPRRSERAACQVAAWIVPAFAGYSILLWSAASRGSGNGAYDAYKLFAVFYPGVLASLCLWLRRLPARSGAAALWSGALFGGLLAGNCAVGLSFDDAVRRSRLVVDQPLFGLAVVDAMPEIASVNICLESYWQRLWANAFLLRKPQYFSLPTYEGRSVSTTPCGDWNLRDGFLAVRPANPADCIVLNPGFRLLRASADPGFSVRLADGWHPPEHHNMETWCWAATGRPSIAVSSPFPRPVSVALRLALLSRRARSLRLVTGADVLLWSGELPADQHATISVPELLLSPGINVLHLETAPPSSSDSPSDRPLTIALYGLELTVRELPSAP